MNPNPQFISRCDLLEDIHTGKVQLPDRQTLSASQLTCVRAGEYCRIQIICHC
jgi:hypothetical protein